jgi:hypothetical protein
MIDILRLNMDWNYILISILRFELMQFIFIQNFLKILLSTSYHFQ